MATIAELFAWASHCQQSGELAEAERLYGQILEADPTNVEALQRLGFLLYGLNRKAATAECFRHAQRVNPLDASIHSNLGKVLADLGELDEAVACYRQALRLQPNHAMVLNNLGSALKSQGHLAEAEECYRQALQIEPGLADAYHNLGTLLLNQQHFVEASACFQRVLQIKPNHLNAIVNLGNALKNQGQVAEAAQSYQEALRLDPNHALANNNLGNLLFEQHRVADAIDCFCQALRSDPGYANAHYNLGNALFVAGRLREADESFGQAARLDPGHKMARWNRSLSRLLQGDYEEGWRDYEFREAQPGLVCALFPQPRWDGSSLQGKTILLHAEQGLGDTIQFIRYAPLVKALGCRVVVECQPALLGLLRRMPGIDQVVPRDDGDATGSPSGVLPAFDVHLPLLSVAGHFRTTLDSIPHDVPYLEADAALVEKWRRELAPLSGRKIGIVWQGNPSQGDDRHRSVPLHLFAPLAKVPGVQLISLQVGPGQEQLGEVQFPIMDLGGRFDRSSLDDLAAALVNLDLVVTVCTSVAHLGGALGVPVWVALKYVPHWVWLLERTDSPWYPSLRLFRQLVPGAWPDLFARIAAAIAEGR